MNSNAIGACAVYQSSSVNFSGEKITKFLKSYQDYRFLSQYSLLDMLTLDEVISIMTFHCSNH